MSHAQPSLIIGNWQPSVPQESGDSREVLALMWLTLRKWWALALVLGVLMALLAMLVVYVTFEPDYRASLWLRIYSKAPFIAFEGKDDSGRFAENQTQFIRSRLVLGAVLADEQIACLKELERADDKVEELARRLTVSPVGRSEYFSVIYRGIEPESAKLVVQSVVDAYMSLQNDEESIQKRDVMDLLDGELAFRQQKVEEFQRSLSQLLETPSVAENALAVSHEERPSMLSDLRAQMAKLDVDLALSKIQIQALNMSRDRHDYAPTSSELELSIDGSVAVQAAESEIAELEDRLLTLSGVGENHPSYKRLRRELESKSQRLGELQARVANHHVAMVRSNQEHEQAKELADLGSQVKILEATRAMIESQISAETDLAKKSSGDLLHVEFLREELQQATEVQNLISQRLLALKTEQRAPARVQTLKTVVPTAIPFEVVPLRKMAIASTFAFSLPSILLFGLEFFFRRVTDIKQLQEHGQLRVIGEIANNPTNRWHHRACRLNCESVDYLQTCLVLQEQTRRFQVLAVTSAVSGEGKTTLAVHLAASLVVATGEKVLLIDADLRRPGIHRRFGLDLSPGLGNVLHGSVDCHTAISQVGDNEPHIMPAGQLLESPHRLFGNGKFGALLESLREHYRYVIIDTPPVLSACESLVIAQAAGSFLHCVRKDRSRLEHARHSHARLVSTGAESFGTVLTFVPFRNYSARYGVYPWDVQSSNSIGVSESSRA